MLKLRCTAVLALLQVPLACDQGAHPVSLAVPAVEASAFTVGRNNPLFPLVPGTTLRYDAVTDQGREIDSFVVTGQTKVILGVTTTVVRDRVWTNGQLTEDTFDWYAPDSQGNVWYFGEDSRQYEDGKLVGREGSWEAGKDGAVQGIIMKAHPKVGDTYRQEYLPGVAEDVARVVSTNETVTVPYGTFTGCLKTKEWTRLEPDIVSEKYHCPGIGEVKAVRVRGGLEISVLTGASGR